MLPTYTNKGSCLFREARNTLPMAFISMGSPVGVPVPVELLTARKHDDGIIHINAKLGYVPWASK